MKLLSCLVFGLAAIVGSASVTGCAQAGEDLDSSSSELRVGVDVPNPAGTYVADVKANGTGCPAGTWDAQISPDGQAFTVAFSAYEATVNPGQGLAVKDCTLSIDLKTPEGFSFSVTSFHYQGYAILTEPGMSARQTAKYYFTGNPVPAQELRSDMNGPYDDSYVFSDDVAVADQVWSPCGATRTLEAQSRLVLRNNPAASGSGYLNTSSVDVQSKTVFRFGLSWRHCGASLPIYRATNPQVWDILQGTTENEGAPFWLPQGVSFKIYDVPDADMQPIFRCRAIDGAPFHFLSLYSNCEGHIPDGQLGFVSTIQRPGLSQLFRCVSQNGRAHLTTMNIAECVGGNLRPEGVQGFAAP